MAVGEMADFDAAGFVTTLEGLGVKWAAVPLADGRFSVTRWKLPSAVEHAREIERLWSLQVGISQARIRPIGASHLRGCAGNVGADERQGRRHRQANT